MHIDYLGKDEFNELLDKLYQNISANMDWYAFFPSLEGYDYFIPDDHDDLDDHPKGCRGDDHVIALLMAGIPSLHDKMIRIINKIITVNRNTPIILDDNEHAGNHFAVELALSDIKYVTLYADFLFSCDLKYEDYQTFDVIKIIKKWGLCPSVYYLLIARWFNQGDCAREDLNYLSCNGFSLKKKLEEESETEKFEQSLALFLPKSGYLPEELQNKYALLFEELVDEYIFPHDHEKAGKLKNHYYELTEKLQNGELEIPESRINEIPDCMAAQLNGKPSEPDSEYPEEDIPVLGPENWDPGENSNEVTGITQPSWSWDDEDIPEI